MNKKKILHYFIIIILIVAVVSLLKNKNETGENKKMMINIEGWDMEYSIPERKLTQEDFENVKLGSSVEEIVKIYGEPDLWVGSGILKPGYVLENGNVIVFYFFDYKYNKDLNKIIIYFPSGEHQIIKQ